MRIMQIIESQKYKLFKQSQKMVNWDNRDADPVDINQYDFQEQYEIPGEQRQIPGTPTLRSDMGANFFDKNLPTVTPEEAQAQYLEDNIESKEGIEPISAEEEEIARPEGYPEFPNILQAFNWAKENKEVLRIYYTTIRGTFVIRDIEAHGHFWARTTLKRILVTWDETVGNIRAFRAENVSKFEFMGRKFVPKFNFSQRQRNYKQRLRRRSKKRQQELKMF